LKWNERLLSVIGVDDALDYHPEEREPNQFMGFTFLAKAAELAKGVENSAFRGGTAVRMTLIEAANYALRIRSFTSPSSSFAR
jgi:hypothetical protein